MGGPDTRGANAKLAGTLGALILGTAALAAFMTDRGFAPRALALDGGPQPVYEIEPKTHPPSSPDLLADGARAYAQSCAACHGQGGAGDGPAAYVLYPRPRNFRTSKYRFISTWQRVPTDDDIYRVISRGIPGSAMPSWAHLPERTRWGLVHHLKSLAETPIVVRPVNVEDKEGPIQVRPRPASTPESIARGRTHFQAVCMPCHGPQGRGDGPSAKTLADDDGYPIRPRDLTTGVFKGSPSPEHLYARILAGIPGTPMPSSEVYEGDDAWHIVHFVLSLSSDRLRERAEMKRRVVRAARVAKVPDHPDSGAWRAIPSVELHLMPLWWRYERPEYLTVQAVHDGTDLALLLAWSDQTDDSIVVRPQDFRDAAAIELSADPDPPFFAMGEKGRFVNIWMWKADREADLHQGFHDMEAQYPDIGIDSYPNLQRAPYEQPTRHALTLESDPTFVTAWGAGNIVADPRRRAAAEDLRAQGFGTLRARADQQVAARGVFSQGSHRVLFRRALAGKGEGAVGLAPRGRYAAAFAVWNGSAGDRNGMKSVTIWQDLELAE